MRYKNLLLFALVSLYSCTQQNRFPVVLSEKFPSDGIKLTKALPVGVKNIRGTEKNIAIDDLWGYEEQFIHQDNDFNLADFERRWDETEIEPAATSELKKWFEATGLLLQLTGKEKYASEMEKLAFSGLGNNREEVERIVAPYVITKNIDHLFINIYTAAEIAYRHTLGGDVKVELDTKELNAGKVYLRFGMTERRYMEINVRIPDWAEGASVTVKKVKYFAQPGEYCKIAKKWKEGDLVEIEFPASKIPGYLKTR